MPIAGITTAEGNADRLRSSFGGRQPPCCFIASPARRFSSSGDRSSLWVAMCQTWLGAGSDSLSRHGVHVLDIEMQADR